MTKSEKPAYTLALAVRLGPKRFDRFVAARFGTPEPGSAKERTMLWARQTGTIQCCEAGLMALRRELESELGISVDLAVVRRGGRFDKSPHFRLADARRASFAPASVPSAEHAS